MVYTNIRQSSCQGEYPKRGQVKKRDMIEQRTLTVQSSEADAMT
jgi:hypothetical protein